MNTATVFPDAVQTDPPLSARVTQTLALDARVNAPIYASLPIVATRAEGSWIWDVDGRRYLDMMSAYSAVSFGHAHPRLLAALVEQAGRLAVTSRAVHSDQLAPFLAEVVRVTGFDKALPMNSGAEAVETAIKAARKWGHRVKGIADGAAEIIVFDNNFHGRTTTIVSFSSHPEYRAGFAPLTAGFVGVPYGDAAAVAAAITPRTCAVLVEPIQGEGGVIVPPTGFFKALRELCDTHHVLLIADEIQTGLGRTGRTLALEHEGIRADAVCLGKALGGGLLPVSALVGTNEVMNVFVPGDHGSTFGGNALAARVGREALVVLEDEHLNARSTASGAALRGWLEAARHPAIAEIRGRGLMLGVEIVASVDAQDVVDALARAGIITKLTHRNTIRLSPPLTIEPDDLRWAADRLLEALDLVTDGRRGRSHPEPQS
ncbi:MAG: ornithine--oxo-acid transaminase [Janthinobacterium lividum]